MSQSPITRKRRTRQSESNEDLSAKANDNSTEIASTQSTDEDLPRLPRAPGLMAAINDIRSELEIEAYRFDDDYWD